MPDLLIRNVRPLGGAPVDLLLQAGRIARLGPAIEPPAGTPAEDGAGEILLPGLVEAHTHLDKTMWGLPWYRNEVGPNLLDKIDNERARSAGSTSIPIGNPPARSCNPA